MDSEMGNDGYEPPARPSGPRLYHKKSRTGCATCKRRRVKCDEKRPSCTGCSRHGVPCVYPSGRPAPARRASPSPGPSVPSQAASGQSPRLEFQSYPQAHQGGSLPLSGTASTTSGTQAHTPESFTAPTAAASVQAAESPYSGGFADRYYYPAYNPGNASCAPATSSSSPPGTFPPSIPDPPESRDRRLWELRLLHNYVRITDTSWEPTGSPPTSFRWAAEVPALALQDSAILYAILAQSALNLWTRAASREEREDMRTLQTTYLAMALREQRSAIAGGLTRATADRVCMASLTILHHSYALVQTTLEDEHGNWQPPLEWLRVGRGTGKVWTVAQGLMSQRRAGTGTGTETGGGAAGGGGEGEDSTPAKILAFLNSKPNFDMDEIFTPANREPYLWLLEDPDPKDPDDMELDGQVTRWVYNHVLSYIGWTAKSIEAGEAEFAVQRRLAAFAVWTQDLFEEFCQQRRPRALVALAWFFSLWIPYRHRWEVNGVGERMVRGIYGVLDEKWRVKLEPLYREYGF